jgi:AIPR protein
LLNNVWRTHRRQRDSLLSADLDAGTPTTRYRVVGVICLRRDRRQRDRALQGRGVIPAEVAQGEIMTSAKSTIITLFKEQLENESSSLAESNNLNKRGDHLIWWYFTRLVGMEANEIDEIVCDGAADLGIDAIRSDEDNMVHFYTFKNPERIDVSFPASEVDKTLMGLNTILTRTHHRIANEELRGRVEEIYQTVPSGYRLHLVTTGSGLPTEASTKLNSFVDTLKSPSDEFFRWSLEDINNLQDAFYRKNLPTVEEPIDFNLENYPYQVRSAMHDSYIFHTSATVLAELYRKHGEQLLQQNIRVYQGDNATNELIRKTATGPESANFLHYNNGVTFLCEAAQYDGFTRKLNLRKAQVVNGGQTLRVLQSVHKSGSLKPEVLVPIRVITSQGDKEFASNVAVDLNNQNRIEPSFLRSNDTRVVQLAAALASLGWYLERRESEVAGFTQLEKAAIESKINGPLDNKVIRLKEGAQAYTATYMKQPEWAKKNPKRIFLGADDSGYFDRVFSNELTAEKVRSST